MIDLTDEELRRVWNMLLQCGYYSFPLNMNDTFGYACAESVDVDFPDMLVVTELYEKYGKPGVDAWASIKEDVHVIKERDTEKYKEARKEIESNSLKYDWIKRYKANKK